MSKHKLLKALEEENVMEEIVNFENNDFQKSDTGIEIAESQLSNMFQKLAQHSCKLVKTFKKRRNKKKPWVDRELSDLKRTVIQLGSMLKKQPFNNQLKSKL